MKKLRALLADHDVGALETLSGLLKAYSSVDVIDALSDPHKIESTILKRKPDVLFVDVDMPHYNGIDIIKNIREYNLDISFVMVANNSKYALDAIKQQVFYYMLKPVSDVELKDVLQRLMLHKNVKIVSNRKVKLPIKNGSLYLDFDDILMLEAEGTYTNIITTKNDAYVSSYNMGRMHSKLPSDVFFRVNRGCVLNSNYLREIDKKRRIGIVKVNDVHRELSLSVTFLKKFNKDSM